MTFTPYNERAQLSDRIAEARTRLAVALADKSLVSVDAARGCQRSLAEFIRLEAVEDELSRDIEILTSAIAALDAKRAEAEDAKRAERVAVGNRRREAIMDIMEREQRADILARIEVLRKQGDTAQVEVWTAALDSIRQNLETACPPIGRKPRGPSHYLGVPPDNAA